MSGTEPVFRVTAGDSFLELHIQMLSDTGVCALVAACESDRIVRVNKAICKALGRTPDELIGSPAAEVLKHKFEDGIQVRRQHTEENSTSFQVISFADGTADYGSDHYELHRIFNEMDELYFKMTLEGMIVDVTPSIFDIGGYSREDVIGTSILDYCVDPARKSELFAELNKTGKVRNFLIDMLKKNGEVIKIRGSLHIVCGGTGTPGSIEGILSDAGEEQRLEKEINKQSMFFREVVESVPDAVVTIDTEGITTGWNKAATDLFGWTAEEAIGQHLDSLVNTGTGKNEISSEAVIMGEVFRGLECTRRGKNPEEKKVSVSAAPITVNEEYQGAVGIYTDLSDRESIQNLLRENEIRFRAVTESAQDAVIIMDADARITFFNSSAERMFGYHRSEIVGKQLHKMIAPEAYWEMIEAGLKQFKLTGQGMMLGRVVEMEGIRKDRTVFPVELSVSSFFLNGGWQATGILRDISERKRIELELIEAREGALNATRTKSEFLANMSHEIRTPLNAIIGTTDLLWETDITSNQRNFLRISRNASDNLLNLINDILDISKVEAGRIELEIIPFNLFEEMEKTCETLALRAHEKGLELNCRIHPETPGWVMGDPSRLKQVIINLIGNSIKFTNKGEITLEVKPLSKDKISFSVTDTGIGIPEGKVEAIFMSFTQADSSHTRRYGGTGLGLAICTRLVEIMGGDISVKSEAGSGSSFSFSCDLPETESMGLSSEFLPVDLTGRHVLVVDDNENNRTILKDIFESWGARTDLADSGTETLGMVRDTKYDIILLDNMMPEMDGCETVYHMRQDSICTGSVIMMLTCDDSNSRMEKCRTSGIDRFVFKPVRRTALSRQILSIFDGTVPQEEVDSSSTESRSSVEKMHLTVLLAEDSPDNRFLIMKYTDTFPWEITVAENGQEALDHYMRKKFDLILMDMQMPVMDGYEATRSIRAHESITMGLHTPIVALTAHALREEVQKCLDAGCDIHISKPVRKKNLVEKLDGLLKIMGSREGTPTFATDPLEIPIKEPAPAGNTAELSDDRDHGPVALVPGDLEPLIPGYLKNRRGDVVKIREFVQAGDYAGAKRLSHSMKGSGGGYGFNRITELGAAMEIAAKSGNDAEILSGIDKLEIYLDTVRIEYVDEE